MTPRLKDKENVKHRLVSVWDHEVEMVVGRIFDHTPGAGRVVSNLTKSSRPPSPPIHSDGKPGMKKSHLSRPPAQN